MQKNLFRPTTVNEYFAWLEQTVNPDTELYRAAHSYMESERSFSPEKTDAPFLSIVTRTQGKRPDMLTETLLCLTGQSNTDFELLLMGHNISQAQQDTLTQMIAELPDWMRERTRLIPVNGGTRTTPLNAGFEAARGRYIAVLDDDDLVFDNWVEAFYDLSLKQDGKILHTYSVLQDWETVSPELPNTPRAAASPNNMFCRDFHFMDELSVNYCPLCTLAFPSYVFHRLGIRFDESLTTTEDWDYLMRCAFLTGVANSSEITFLYRNWLNAENSTTVHGKEEWARNYKKIVERFVKTPILLHSGALHGIIDRNLPGEEKKDEERILFPETDMQLYYDDGNGFSIDTMLPWSPNLATSKFGYCFAAGKKEECKHAVTSIRFDPQFYGFLTLSNLTIRVIEADGSKKQYTADDVETNGYRFGDSFVFLKEDPQVILHFQSPVELKQVLICCQLVKNVEDTYINAILDQEAKERHKSLVYRALRKLYRLCKKIWRRIKG